MLLETDVMKRWTIAGCLLLGACASSPAPPSLSGALAAAIPQGTTPAERRDIFRAAITLFDGGRPGDSEPLFLSVSGGSAELADYALRYVARIAEARSDPRAAVERWQALATRHPESVWRSEAALALGTASKEAGDLATAERWLEIARSEGKQAAVQAPALWLLSQVAELSGDQASARRLARELRSRHAGSAEAAAARRSAWERRSDWALRTADEAREEVTLLLSEGQAPRALELARLAAERFPADEDLAELLRLEATALGKTGDAEGSVRLLEEMRRRFPRHPAAAKALYRIAMSSWNRDDDDAALALFREYGRTYPKDAEAAAAIYAIARIHQEARNYPMAVAEYERLVRSFPAASLAGEARWRIAWSEYQAGNRAAAARLFGRIGAGNASDRPGALYWRARALGEAGTDDFEVLLGEFPESYYAALAESRLGRPDGSALAETPIILPANAPPTCGVSDPHRVRFEELRAIGLRRFARLELAAFEPRAEGPCDDFLMFTWHEIEGFRQAVARAQRSGGCGVTGGLLRFCYPLGFWETLRGKAAERVLDPYLVLALIRQESLFDPEARSAADAVGLMQILPSTGSRIATEIGYRDFRRESLLDPERNIDLGTAYLRKLLDRYRGNWPRAVAAYNAGEGAVDKWQRRYPDVEDDEFVEAISFRETRSYVKRVLQGRRIYRALYVELASSRDGARIAYLEAAPLSPTGAIE